MEPISCSALLMTTFLSAGVNYWREVSAQKSPQNVVVNTIETNQPVFFKNDNLRSSTPNIIIDLLLLKNLNTLERFKSLKENWNLYGAKPLDANLIDSCRELIKTLPYQPDIFPTANSSIQLEYENSKKDYLELEFFNSDNIAGYIQYKTGREEYFKVTTQDIKNIVDDFYA